MPKCQTNSQFQARYIVRNAVEAWFTFWVICVLLRNFIGLHQAHHFTIYLYVNDCKNAISLLPQDHPGEISYNATSHEFAYPCISPNAHSGRHRLLIYITQDSCILAI